MAICPGFLKFFLKAVTFSHPQSFHPYAALQISISLHLSDIGIHVSARPVWPPSVCPIFIYSSISFRDLHSVIMISILTRKLVKIPNFLSFSINPHCSNLFLSHCGPISNYVHSRLSANISPPDPFFIAESRNQATRFWFTKHLRQVLWSGILPEYLSHSYCINTYRASQIRQFTHSVAQYLT